MTACHVCERPRDGWPYAVTMRNGLRVPACQVCWQKWPDEHKTFPVLEGFGRQSLVDLLRETAP
jgi:hypothetical protein